MMMKKKKDGVAPSVEAKKAPRNNKPPRQNLLPVVRKSTPKFSNDEYKSKTLPRSNSRGTEGSSLRWEVDSRIQLEKVATKIYAGEVDSRAQKAGAMAARKKHMDAVKVLLASRADVDLPDKFGRTPSQYAASNGSSDLSKALAAGADIQLSDRIAILEKAKTDLARRRTELEERKAMFESLEMV